MSMTCSQLDQFGGALETRQMEKKNTVGSSGGSAPSSKKCRESFKVAFNLIYQSPIYDQALNVQFEFLPPITIQSYVREK